MTTILPPSISAGPPVSLGPLPSQKALGQRADFDPDKYDNLIEWHGLRLAWSRATVCPCIPSNLQTEQADPSCSLCEGAGYLYFNSSTPQDPSLIGDLTPVQQKVVRQGAALVVRGLMTGMGTSETPFERLGRLPAGQAIVTVRANNRLGHLDRLVSLDAYIVHSEKVELTDPLARLPLRYLVDGGVNVLASTDQRFLPDIDFVVTDGDILWLPGRAPVVGTYLTVHYHYHPQYLVIEQPHATRLTYTPKGGAGQQTPEGRVTQFPLQAMVRLDWMEGISTAGVVP